MGDDHGRKPGPGGPPSSGRRAAGSSVLTPPLGLSVVPDAAHAIPHARPAGSADGPSATVVAPCLCGHAPDLHRHWRRGSDCGQCGVGECTAYRPRRGTLRRLLDSVSSRR